MLNIVEQNTSIDNKKDVLMVNHEKKGLRRRLRIRTMSMGKASKLKNSRVTTKYGC